MVGRLFLPPTVGSASMGKPASLVVFAGDVTAFGVIRAVEIEWNAVKLNLPNLIFN